MMRRPAARPRARPLAEGAPERISGVGGVRPALARLRGERPERHWRRKALMAVLGRGPKPTALGLRQRFSVARAGFFPANWELYGLDGKVARGYLNDHEHERTWAINGSARWILDDKVLFALLARSFGVPVAPVLAILAAGPPRWLAPPSNPIDERSLRDRLERRRLVVKPVAGRGGRGFHTLSLAGDGFALNDERLDWNGLERFLRRLDYFLVSEHVEQPEYARELFPDTTNTVRILTIIPADDAEPEIAAAVNRIGTRRSRPVDNWVRGGLSAAIDLHTGVLGPAASAGSPGGRWHEAHPDTGARIAGARIHDWEAVRRVVIEGARRFAMVPYIAWDVIASDAGEPTIIEGNHFTSVDVFQVHGPLLDNPVLRDFYASRGILEDR